MPSVSGAAFWILEEIQRHLTAEHLFTIGCLWVTVLFAAIVTYMKIRRPGESWRGFLHHLIPRGTFHHPSARADFLFWLSRRVFMPLLVIPTAITTVTAGHLAYRAMTGLFGVPVPPADPASPLLLLGFTVTMLLAYDLSYYIYHVAQHKIPLLWELHKVHHSAEVMVGVTRERVHPLDEIMNRWWDGVIPGLAYGVWLFFLKDPIEVTVFGLNVYFIRSTFLMMDFVRHTHLPLSYGRWLNRVFLCPYHHQLHHSVAEEHWDKNFGLMLSVWDWLFGTMVIPRKGEAFHFGLANGEHDEYQSLSRLHVVPLIKIYRRLFTRRGSDAQEAA